MANQNDQQISSLQQTLGNLDDYKLQAELAVPFGFNQDKLTPEAKEQLDQFVKEHTNSKMRQRATPLSEGQKSRGRIEMIRQFGPGAEPCCSL